MKFSEMKYLKEGWDSYHAPTPSDVAISKAKQIDEMFEHFKPSSINPCADGGITMVYAYNHKSFMIDCYNNGEVCWAFNNADGSSEYGEFSGIYEKDYLSLEYNWNKLLEESLKTGSK